MSDVSVGMKLEDFMSGALQIVSDSPLRAAEIRNGLKNEGLSVAGAPDRLSPLSHNFANQAALIQPAAQVANVMKPSPTLALNATL